MSEGVKEKQQVRYWQKRSLQLLPEMRAAKAAGLFPKKEGWRNVPEHGLVEGEAMLTEDGEDIGEQNYLTYGQGKDEYRGVISAATLELAEGVR